MTDEELVELVHRIAGARIGSPLRDARKALFNAWLNGDLFEEDVLPALQGAIGRLKEHNKI